MKPTNNLRIAILGSGSWGTTFAKVVADSATARNEDVTVVLWARRAEVAEDINTRHQNSQYLGDVVLPDSIRATVSIEEAVTDADVVVLAVPSQSARATLEQARPHIGDETVMVSLIKGLELATEARMSEVFASALGISSDRFVVVSGPNLAMEIAREEPTATVIACTDEQTAAWMVQLTASPYFRPYRNTDVVGVEMGGVVKNVIALAVGLTDGQGMGDNSKASIITRGLTETTRLANALGADPDTLAGLAGLGDLVATCASPLSRNRTAGKLYGQGKTTDQVIAEMSQTAEGVKSVPAVVGLAHRHGVEMPISEAMNALVKGAIDIDSMASLLLGRKLKSEDRL